MTICKCVSLLLPVIGSEYFSCMCWNLVICICPQLANEWYSGGLLWAKWSSCSNITWIGRKVSYTSSKSESQSVVRSFTSHCTESGPVLKDSSCLAIGMTRQSGHVPSWHFGKRPSVEFSFVNLPFTWRTYTQDSLPQLSFAVISCWPILSSPLMCPEYDTV